LDRASLWRLKNKRPTWCHLIFYFTSYVLNMFRTLIYPSSGACDYSVELPHWSYCSWFDVCWSFQTHWNSNTHRTTNNTTNVVIQQNSRELLLMDILMSETCWAHKKWIKIASDIKLVFYSSTITMMHGPIYIRLYNTTPTQPHRNSNAHRTKNNTTNVVIQQDSRKLLMMDILMSETCWAHKKWNKIASDIKLVFYFFNYSSTIEIGLKMTDWSIIETCSLFNYIV